MAALKKAEISAGGLRNSSLMRTAPLTRKTPLKAGGGLARTPFKRRAPKKRPGYHEPKYLAACRGEPCYLQIPGVCRGERESVVPCHANWSAYGKGMGLKVHDRFTVPACHFCHALYDQSGIDREIKRATFNWAYTRWVPVRASKMGTQ